MGKFSMTECKLFLSYKRGPETTPVVERLYNRVRVELMARNVRPFFDRKSIEAGDAWETKIDDFIKTASLFAAFISIDFWLSTQCMRELEMAVDRYEKEGAPRLLFILADQLSPSDLAFDEQWASQREDAVAAAAARSRVNRVKAIGQFNFLGPYDDAGALTRLEFENPAKTDLQLAQLVATMKKLKELNC
jgi:hypothetical protein